MNMNFFNFLVFTHILCQVEGHGETLSKFPSKIAIFSLDRIEFYLVFDFTHIGIFQNTWSIELNT